MILIGKTPNRFITVWSFFFAMIRTKGVYKSDMKRVYDLTGKKEDKRRYGNYGKFGGYKV